MSFKVLMVCTGNICRSPLAERMFRARIRPGIDVRVRSAGTHAVVGHAIDQPSAVVLGEFGIDANGHEAQQLDAQMFESADLILTATVDQRRILLEADPRLLTKIFTLREFGRLAAEVGQPAAEADCGEHELRVRIAAVARRRGIGDPVDFDSYDIADPYRASTKVVRATAATILQAVDAVIVGLGLTPVTASATN